MKKRRIVIASVLKPVDDTRMFEKMAVSLSSIPDYEVYVIGQSNSSIPVHAGIHFIAHKAVKRLSLLRLLRPIQIGIDLIKVKPGLLIVNTHELLIVSIINKILFGTRIVYDIRENYYRNIRFSDTFPQRWRLTLARYIRWKEQVAAPWIKHFTLAEKAYEWQLPFIAKRFTIFENKAIAPLVQSSKSPSDIIKLLFSGTIAESTGIFEAIALAESLNKEDKKFTLTVIGHCAIYATRKKILKSIKDKPYIRLVGFNKLVPHAHIIDEIKQADFGIVIYPTSEHTSSLMPTKLYEYMTHQLPILTRLDQSFAQMVIANEAGLVTDDYPEGLAEKLTTTQFYRNPIPDITWEGNRFIEFVAQQLV